VASARAHNLPPRVVSVRAQSGAGPLTRSFVRLERSSGGAVLSALKQAEDRASVIVRLFNPDDVEASATVALDRSPASAYAVNVLEERQEEIRIAGGAIPVALRPHEIKTIEIDSSSPGPRIRGTSIAAPRIGPVR
jgi:alpha-mannosidase